MHRAMKNDATINHPTGRNENLYQDLTILLKCISADSLRPLLARDYLRVLDHLNMVIEQEDGHHLLTLWRDLASFCELSEPVLRRVQRKETERLLNLAGTTGCSWFKCPIFQIAVDDLPLDLFLCADCRRVAYCRPYCQKR